MFDLTSRYTSIETATLDTTAEDGRIRTIAYKRRRFIPHTGDQTTLLEHTFIQGDRLDNLTARYMGDPAQFWRVCDTNVVLQPAELEEIGRMIRIAVPHI